MQGEPVKEPEPLLVKLTVPDGVLTVPGEESVAVAVHVADWPILTGFGLQLMLVPVTRLLAVTALPPTLGPCVESPP